MAHARGGGGSYEGAVDAGERRGKGGAGAHARVTREARGAQQEEAWAVAGGVAGDKGVCVGGWGGMALGLEQLRQLLSRGAIRSPATSMKTGSRAASSAPVTPSDQATVPLCGCMLPETAHYLK